MGPRAFSGRCRQVTASLYSVHSANKAGMPLGCLTVPPSLEHGRDARARLRQLLVTIE